MRVCEKGVGPNIDHQCTILLIMGTPKMVSAIPGNGRSHFVRRKVRVQVAKTNSSTLGGLELWILNLFLDLPKHCSRLAFDISTTAPMTE